MKLIITAGTQGRNTVLDIHKDASVEELFRKISEWNGIAAESQRVIFAGRQLQAKKDGKKQYLTDYKLEDRSQLFVVYQLPGGNDPEPTSSMQKVLDDAVELTDAPDMITWDDDPDNKRAKMPCGHAIGPESLTAYCRSLLTSGKCQFHCPYIDPNDGSYCGKIWEYFQIRRLAVLTTEEKEEFEKKLSQNYMRKASGIQECPKCTTFCVRQNKKDRRVICLFCSKDGTRYEFCWYCLGDWSNESSTSICGNLACTGEDPRLKILRDAEKKEIVGLRGCPSIRACPNCGLLINHTKACKHMVCICGQKFCFICLAVPVDDEYQCGTFNSHCTIAEVQTSIPGEN